MQKVIAGLIVLAIVFSSCDNLKEESKKETTTKIETKGALFIIGGGKRPPALVKDLIQLSEVDKGGYIVVLPMSSSEPDTSAWWAMRQFKKQNITNVTYFNFEKGEKPAQDKIDSIKNARLIYVSGGDQNKFMGIVKNTPIYDAMHYAYINGATIAGTSAGAAIMSKKMITGNEYKHPEYTGEFRTIEAENIEIKEGMGFTDKLIVDQHFVWRMRMNRLMSVAIENPEEIAVGIDESTAIYVKSNNFTVYGKSQVIVIENPERSKVNKNGLLGANDLKLSILLPGDTYNMVK
ncbi:MAG: cyanophycinase [Salinivirgaceae bacterium]|nr:MAG: cyanophycinase [Salinivirgaceae bacterium]